MSKTNPVVTIDLDKERHLVYDLNAMADFEEKTGLNTLRLDMREQMSATNFRFLLWACLHQEDPSLDIEKVKQITKDINATYIAQKVAQAMTEAMPEAKPGVPLVQQP